MQMAKIAYDVRREARTHQFPRCLRSSLLLQQGRTTPAEHPAAAAWAGGVVGGRAAGPGGCHVVKISDRADKREPERMGSMPGAPYAL
jgi:hypothetical protein